MKLYEEEEEEFVCFTDQKKNTISLPLTTSIRNFSTARLVKEISLQLDPGKLIVNDAAYGPSDEDVPKINQQTVGQFDFKALSSIKIS